MHKEKHVIIPRNSSITTKDGSGIFTSFNVFIIANIDMKKINKRIICTEIFPYNAYRKCAIMIDINDATVPGMNFTNPIPNIVDNNNENLFDIDMSIDWIISNELVNYQDSINFMNFNVDGIILRQKKEIVWLLQHNHVYTKGMSAHDEDLLIENPKIFNNPSNNLYQKNQNCENVDMEKDDDLKKNAFCCHANFLNYSFDYRKNATTNCNLKKIDINEIPVVMTNRGGKFTYHGPGQKICYLMINLMRRNLDVREYIKMLEELIINVLKNLGINAFLKKDLIGVWTNLNGEDKKIAAIGVKVKKHVTMHGFSINNYNNLDLFKGIVPCGIRDYGVCSLQEFGINCSDDFLNLLIQTSFYKIF